MDPIEWQQMADAAAASLGSRIAQLESTFWPQAPGGSFRVFWPTVKQLMEAVRSAPAIKLEDKLALQHRLNELCQRARHDQKLLQAERVSRERELLDAISLATGALEESTTIEEIKEIRADLALLRERIATAARDVPGRHNRAIWTAWQATNQAAWTRLNALWNDNEAQLASLLDAAEQNIGSEHARSAKESIKEFHASVPMHECAHRGLRSLRIRAASLWRQADELGREKHQQYVEQAEKRTAHWRTILQRHTRARADIEHDIARLEQQMAAATTDVGTALMRGQLEARRRTLAELEADGRDLERRIDATEALRGG